MKDGRGTKLCNFGHPDFDVLLNIYVVVSRRQLIYSPGGQEKTANVISL